MAKLILQSIPVGILLSPCIALPCITKSCR
jgi:hypothetical protein